MAQEQFSSERPAACQVERVSPVDGRLVSREPADDPSTCRDHVARAAAAFPAWSRTPPAERATLLVQIAELLEERAEQFVTTMTEEVGAPLKWAQHNVTFAAELLRVSATYASQANRVERIAAQGGIESLVERAPCGVCLGIAPWNAPLILGMRAVAAPLLCGNTVLLKGSEFAPATFRSLGKTLADAGLPENVARVILTRDEDSEAAVEVLIGSPVVRRVSFTGSTRVGRRIAELCALHLKPSVLELGGQAAMVVLEDADLDVAAEAAVTGAFCNQGQICMSTERLIVVESVADSLITNIEARRQALRLGDPADSQTDLGPVVSISDAERLSGLVGDAVSRGARLVGGGRMRDAYVEPTLLDHVEPTMRLYSEEVFGPILSVTRVADELEALTVVNDSQYGLAASVFSRNIERATALARKIESGICHINRPTVDDNPHAPFGGVKASGYGRLGGRWGIEEFTEVKWITRGE